MMDNGKQLIYYLPPVIFPGGLQQMRTYLKWFKHVGTDIICLGQIFKSPTGHDVTNYKEVDPRYGTNKDLELFITDAHNLGIKVILTLDLNHTSVEHEWFKNRPEYYCLHRSDMPGWLNLFDGKAAWHYRPDRGLYYLSLKGRRFADLKWFNPATGTLNEPLVNEFRSIKNYWLNSGVDGFNLAEVQWINKNFRAEEIYIDDILEGDLSIAVINSVFEGREDLFMMMSLRDPDFYEEYIQKYADYAHINAAINPLVKLEKNIEEMGILIENLTINPHFALNLDDDESSRFASREDVAKNFTTTDPAYGTIWMLFVYNPHYVVAYPGQETGRLDPTKEELPDMRLVQLDPYARNLHINGYTFDEIRKRSRANNLVAISPEEEYVNQAADPDSYLNYFKQAVRIWKDTL